MNRTAGVSVLLAALGGCVSTDHGPAPTCGGGCGNSAMAVPGVVGPWGQPVPMQAPYSAAPPGAMAAQAMMNRSVPLDLAQAHGIGLGMGSVVQAGAQMSAGMPSSIVQAGGACPPGGCPPGGGPGCGMPSMTTAPGMPLGPLGPGACPPPGAVAAVGALTGGGGMPGPFCTQRTSVYFTKPEGLKVSWYAVGGGDSQLQVPFRYNFAQGAIYRFKLTNIPNRNTVLYPTLEVWPANAKTATFLAHSSVPVIFTDEDFDQVAANNFVVKVIYLPDPPFQDLATAGLGEIVSTRLEPGADPIAEACHRGSILAVIRLGNIDLEAPQSPTMDAPAGSGAHAMAPPAMTGPGQMLPPGPGGPILPPNYPASGAPRMLPPNTGSPAARPGVPSAKLEDRAPIQQTGTQDSPAFLPPPVESR